MAMAGGVLALGEMKREVEQRNDRRAVRGREKHACAHCPVEESARDWRRGAAHGASEASANGRRRARENEPAAAAIGEGDRRGVKAGAFSKSKRGSGAGYGLKARGRSSVVAGGRWPSGVRSLG